MRFGETFPTSLTKDDREAFPSLCSGHGLQRSLLVINTHEITNMQSYQL